MQDQPPGSEALRGAAVDGLRRTLARIAATEPAVRALVRVPALRTLRHVSLGAILDALEPPSAPAQHRHLTPLPSSATAAPATLDHLLSRRQLEVVCLVAEGLSNKAIGLRMGLSDKTVKNHISRILAKLGLTARTQIAILALRSDML